MLLRGEPLELRLLVAPVEEPAKRGTELEELAVGRVVERQGRHAAAGTTTTGQGG